MSTLSPDSPESSDQPEKPNMPEPSESSGMPPLPPQAIANAAPKRKAGPKIKLPKRWIAAGALLIVLGIGLAWWLSRPRGPEYQTLSLAPESLVETIDVSGVVESERSVSLKAGVSARVLARKVSENQRVAAGTPLLSLDTDTLNLQLSQARTQAQTGQQQARSELDSASNALAELSRRKQQSLVGLRNQVQKAEENLYFLERELGRQQRLLAEQAVTAQSVDQQRQQVEMARIELANVRSNLDTALRTDPELVNARSREQAARTGLENARRSGEAAVALARGSLRQAALLAPFAGTVTSWSVQRGDYLTPGALVARFQDLADLRLVLALNELDFPRVRNGAQVEISFDAYPNQVFKGKVSWLSAASVPSAESQQAGGAGSGSGAGSSAIQVFPVKVWFGNPGMLIKPGMSGDARITVARRDKVLAVPISAIDKQGDRYTVKVLRGGKPVETTVTPGISTLDKVEIKTGLKAGDQLVLDEALPSPGPSK